MEKQAPARRGAYDAVMTHQPPSPDAAAGPPPSGLDAALARVGDRWALLIVAALLTGSRRFNDLAEALPGISPNVLSSRLKHLEREGVVVARPYSRRPLRLDYQLTAAGHELAGALRLLAHWGGAAAGEPSAPRHASCGTPLEARWYCPTCARMVEDDEPEDVRHL